MANQSNNTTGWVLLIVMLGAMAGLTALDLMKMQTWNEIQTPQFVGITLAHFSVVVGSFMGGKMIQDPRDPNLKTRQSDNKE